MHSGDLAELSSANLTGTEREALLQVMQRAKVSVWFREGREGIWKGYEFNNELLWQGVGGYVKLD